MTVYHKIEIYAAPEADGASFAITRDRLRATIAYADRSFKFADLGLDPREVYYIRTRGIHFNGRFGPASSGQLINPTPTIDTRPIVIVQTGANQTITTSITNLAFSNVISDQWSIAATPLITIPKTGLYSLGAKYLCERTTAPAANTSILALGRVNGSTAALFSHITITPSSGQLFTLVGESTLALEKNDEIGFAIQKTSADGVFRSISTTALRVEYLGYQFA